jgi:hypothetical protein
MGFHKCNICGLWTTERGKSTHVTRMHTDYHNNKKGDKNVRRVSGS